jgi:hypothetical protein
MKNEVNMPPKVLNRDYASRIEEEAEIQAFEDELVKNERTARIKFFAILAVSAFIVGGYLYSMSLIMNTLTTTIPTMIESQD